MKHMISCDALDTRHIKILVLDEVDTMLSRGFEEQVMYKQYAHAVNLGEVARLDNIIYCKT